MTLTPIETRYKGYRFRSRLEARWAVFFDAMGWEWGYEVEGYELEGVGRYLPDFVIEDRFFVEIKPSLDTFDDRTISVCSALGSTSGKSVWVIVGSPGEATVELFNSPIDSGHDVGNLAHCRQCGGPALLNMMHGDRFLGFCRPSCARLEMFRKLRVAETEIVAALKTWHEHATIDELSAAPPLIVQLGEALNHVKRACLSPIGFRDSAMLKHAILAARGARFEHGESGGGV